MFCTEITDNVGTFEACATGEYYGPSPMSNGNETIYIGGFNYMYKIVQGLKAGDDTSALSDSAFSEAYSIGIEIDVIRDDADECNVTVTVANMTEQCSFCTYCGLDNYTVNCGNIENGRSTDCEAAVPGTVFFPLTATALGVEAVPRNDTNAPSAEPVPAPAGVGTME